MVNKTKVDRPRDANKLSRLDAGLFGLMAGAGCGGSGILSGMWMSGDLVLSTLGSVALLSILMVICVVGAFTMLVVVEHGSLGEGWRRWKHRNDKQVTTKQ